MNAPQLSHVNPVDSSMVGSEGSLLTEPRKYSVVNPRMSMDGGKLSAYRFVAVKVVSHKLLTGMTS